LILSSWISNNHIEGFTANFRNFCLTGNPRAGSDYPNWPAYVTWKNLFGDMNDLAASGNYRTKSATHNGGTAAPFTQKICRTIIQ